MAAFRVWYISKFVIPEVGNFRHIVRAIAEFSSPSQIQFDNYQFTLTTSQEIIDVRSDFHPSLPFLCITVEYAADYRYIDGGGNFFVYTTGPFQRCWRANGVCAQIQYLKQPLFHPVKPLMAIHLASWSQNFAVYNLMSGASSNTSEWRCTSSVLAIGVGLDHTIGHVQTSSDQLRCQLQCQIQPDRESILCTVTRIITT